MCVYIYIYIHYVGSLSLYQVYFDNYFKINTIVATKLQLELNNVYISGDA